MCVVYVDPETRQRISVDKRSHDVQYLANKQTTSSAVYNETMPVVGNWEDYTGSATVNSQNQQIFAGITNQLQGTTAAIEGGAKLPVLNEVGQRAQTTRRRQRFIYRKLSDLKPQSNF